MEGRGVTNLKRLRHQLTIFGSLDIYIYFNEIHSTRVLFYGHFPEFWLQRKERWVKPGFPWKPPENIFHYFSYVFPSLVWGAGNLPTPSAWIHLSTANVFPRQTFNVVWYNYNYNIKSRTCYNHESKLLIKTFLISLIKLC